MDAIKVGAIELRRGLRTAEAFHRIIDGCLQHAGLNAELIRDDSPETVHQTRVGFRRARAALALFKPYLRKRARNAMYDSLREMGRHLAPCRDWDVFLTETLPRIAKHFPEVEIPVVQKAARERREEAYRNLDANSVIQASRLEIDCDEATPIQLTAADMIDRQYFSVRHWCRHIDTPDDCHKLRKTMKKLRYSAEFLGGLFDQKPVRQFVDHCKDMQDVLGKLNDINTTRHLFEQLELHEVNLPVEWVKHQEARAQQRLPEMTGKFFSTKPFWD